MHVSLTPELERLVHEKVGSGRYNNASEVVREALRLLEKHELREQAKLELLRRELNKGLSDLDAGMIVDTPVTELWDEILAEEQADMRR